MTTRNATTPLDLRAVTYEVDPDGIAWITLAREDAANARDQRMRSELGTVYAAIAADESVKVVVLTGAGDRFFCAGMDLKEASGPESPLRRRERLREGRDIEVLAHLPRPTIAMLNGYALGGGLEMALACDLRIMASDAQVGLPEVSHGLTPGGGATQRLPRLIGLARAAEMIYLGKRLDGPRAAALGLVNQHVPREDLRTTVEGLARAIAAQPATALRAAKEALLAGLELPLSAGIDRELDGLLFLLAERDHSAAADQRPDHLDGTRLPSSS